MSAISNGRASRLLNVLVLVAMCQAATADTFRNPILRGSYPDPSICRDESGYYLVNSTFEYYPGLPIHHSTDLINWELIGYGLHRPEQVSSAVNLIDVQSNGGIHAPTIRCHEGRYYIITTNVYLPPGEGAETEFVNFVITADDPRGPWSEPKVLDGAPGIDPDIFFDDNGRTWYVGTHSPENPNFPGEGEIWLQEIDTDEWKLIGERHFLWRGACGGVWAEGPHMYKRDGRYYLMVAEGGTSFNHAVVIAVSDDITGPYQSNPRNPILTSRHLSYDHWVNSTGHADLIELPDGRWYMVALGIRGDENRLSNMGRETHLIPVAWEREPFWWQEVKTEWPVAAPETGRVERTNPVPFEGTKQVRDNAFTDNFDGEQPGLDWVFRRLPRPGSYDVGGGALRLHASKEAIVERGRASLIGIRQTESDFEFGAAMSFGPEADGAEAGVAVVQDDENFLTFTIARRDGDHYLRAELAIRYNDASQAVERKVIAERRLVNYAGQIGFSIESIDDEYRLHYTLDFRSYMTLATTAADQLLSNRYTGAYLSLYATGNGRDTDDYARFTRVNYLASER